jgi:hypothetical protein
MSDSAANRPIPARAIASVLFACCSFFLLGLSGSVHWLPSRFAKDSDEIFHRVVSLTGPIRDCLDIGYRVLALISVVWCVWSWRAEQRAAAITAAIFASLAILCAVFIVI